MNAGNRAGRALTIHGIQRRRLRGAEYELAVRGGNESAHSFGRNRTRCARVNGLHVDARFVARFCAGKYNVLAIREKASAATVNRIMSDLLCLTGAKGN